jgi:hypothetical protein
VRPSGVEYSRHAAETSAEDGPVVGALAAAAWGGAAREEPVSVAPADEDVVASEAAGAAATGAAGDAAVAAVAPETAAAAGTACVAAAGSGGTPASVGRVQLVTRVLALK